MNKSYILTSLLLVSAIFLTASKAEVLGDAVQVDPEIKVQIDDQASQAVNDWMGLQDQDEQNETEPTELTDKIEETDATGDTQIYDDEIDEANTDDVEGSIEESIEEAFDNTQDPFVDDIGGFETFTIDE